MCDRWVRISDAVASERQARSSDVRFSSGVRQAEPFFLVLGDGFPRSIFVHALARNRMKHSALHFHPRLVRERDLQALLHRLHVTWPTPSLLDSSTEGPVTRRQGDPAGLRAVWRGGSQITRNAQQSLQHADKAA
jgi:hypothetical protein